MVHCDAKLGSWDLEAAGGLGRSWAIPATKSKSMRRYCCYLQIVGLLAIIILCVCKVLHMAPCVIHFRYRRIKDHNGAVARDSLLSPIHIQGYSNDSHGCPHSAEAASYIILRTIKPCVTTTKHVTALLKRMITRRLQQMPITLIQVATGACGACQGRGPSTQQRIEGTCLEMYTPALSSLNCRITPHKIFTISDIILTKAKICPESCCDNKSWH